MNIKEIRRRNLQALLNDYLLRKPRAGKAKFAEEIGIPPSQLSQLTSDREIRNIGDVMARRIESTLKLDYGWMDSQQWGPNPDSPFLSKAIDLPGEKFTLHSERSVYTDRNHSTDQKYILEVLDTEFSCGGGRLNSDYPEIIRSIELDPEEAKRMFGGRQASSLKIATAMGDSMLGSISPGELVVLDITVKRFVSDGIYAFVYGDNFHIKRLQLLKDRLIVISDNASYDRWEVTNEDEELFHIQGFVVGKWQMSYTRLG
ncbi:S24 family peptidase [Enterobacter chengduensis]|uniref:S24 family peptidase n=1 Tax=Enterobacter chengduensis TaxID=2494701 RepID=UPI003D6E52B0